MSQGVQCLRGVRAAAEQNELINAYIGARFFYLHFALITGMCSEVRVTVSFFSHYTHSLKTFKVFFFKNLIHFIFDEKI